MIRIPFSYRADQNLEHMNRQLFFVSAISLANRFTDSVTMLSEDKAVIKELNCDQRMRAGVAYPHLYRVDALDRGVFDAQVTRICRYPDWSAFLRAHPRAASLHRVHSRCACLDVRVRLRSGCLTVRRVSHGAHRVNCARVLRRAGLLRQVQHFDPVLPTIDALCRGVPRDHPRLAQALSTDRIRFYRHQFETIDWMLARESDERKSTWDMLPLTLVLGRPVFYSLSQNEFSVEPPGAPRGGLLCSAMGVGKTICVLGMLLLDRNRGRRTLVVCSVSLVGQWADELRRKGGLSVHVYHGSRRAERLAAADHHDVVVTTCGVVRSEHGATSPIFATAWHRLVVDESHTVGASTMLYSALCAVRAPRRWCLSGTPMSRVAKLLPQLGIIGCPEVRGRTGRVSLAALRRLAASHTFVNFLRTYAFRYAADHPWVRAEASVPRPRTRTVVVKATVDELSRYDQLVQKARRRRGTRHLRDVLMIEPLRRFCSSGATEATSTVTATPEDVAFVAANNCSICIEPFDVPVLTACGHYFCEECIATWIHHHSACPLCRGDVGITRTIVQTSPVAAVLPSKLCTLLEHLSQHPRKKFVVFSAYAATVRTIGNMLKQKNHSYLCLTGSMSRVRRSRALSRFADPDDPVRIFLLSTRSSAEGINLTSASVVVLFEPSMSDAVHTQAIGRVVRTGQMDVVDVVSYVLGNTIEVTIAADRPTYKELAGQLLA